nr:hypothetical protein [Tanacetum cinerariifolium]
MEITEGMMSDKIKAFAEYLNYMAKSTSTQSSKGQGKGLTIRKGIEVDVQKKKKETIKVPRKKRTKTFLEETGQSEDLADSVSLEETEANDEERHLNERRSSLFIGRE